MAEAPLHTGTVVSVADGRAEVRLDRDSACSGCASCVEEGGAILARVSGGEKVRPGDLVTLEGSPEMARRGALLLFGSPMLGMLTGAFIGEFVFMAGIGLAVGFILGCIPPLILRAPRNRERALLRIRSVSTL